MKGAEMTALECLPRWPRYSPPYLIYTFTNSSASDTSSKTTHTSANVSSIVDATRRNDMHSALLVDLKSISEGMLCLHIDARIRVKINF